MRSVNTRYYYGSLLAALPFAGICIARLVEFLAARAPARARLRQGLAAGLLATLPALSLARWPRVLDEFVGWRGTALRRVLQAPAPFEPHALRRPRSTSCPWMRPGLVRAYDLH